MQIELAEGNPKDSPNVQRGNVEIALLASAVRNATNNTPDQTNLNGRGIVVTLDITAVPGIDTITLTIQAKDSLSGKYVTVLAGAAEVGAVTRVYKVYPGLPATANVSANDVLPRVWRVLVTHSAGSNFTYSVGAVVVV